MITSEALIIVLNALALSVYSLYFYEHGTHNTNEKF